MEAATGLLYMAEVCVESHNMYHTRTHVLYNGMVVDSFMHGCHTDKVIPAKLIGLKIFIIL